jgi:hypothetical protein
MILLLVLLLFLALDLAAVLSAADSRPPMNDEPARSI